VGDQLAKALQKAGVIGTVESRDGCVKDRDPIHFPHNVFD
jgi:hypothetical protein